MCTAITYQTKDFYFGRTLDHVYSHGEEVTVTPRSYPLPFRSGETLHNHFAIIGMALVAEDYPLYFDAVNEKGLAMAGLNFLGNAHYYPHTPEKTNIAQFEFLPWVLAQCGSTKEARELIQKTNLTDTAFREDLPPAQLHWLIADRHEAITVEATKARIRVYANPVGVLTNNPPFDQQMLQLNNYMHISAAPPENRFCPGLPLAPYSYGMGSLGLPGDLSSQSRFVRAAFVRANSLCGTAEAESVGQFFHILGTVEQPRGCCRIADKQYEYTLYTSCCNADKGIYYYTSYHNRQITAVDMHAEDLDSTQLIRYPLQLQEQIFLQNPH